MMNDKQKRAVITHRIKCLLYKHNLEEIGGYNIDWSYYDSPSICIDGERIKLPVYYKTEEEYLEFIRTQEMIVAQKKKYANEPKYNYIVVSTYDSKYNKGFNTIEEAKKYIKESIEALIVEIKDNLYMDTKTIKDKRTGVEKGIFHEKGTHSYYGVAYLPVEHTEEELIEALRDRLEIYFDICENYGEGLLVTGLKLQFVPIRELATVEE